MIRWAIKRPCRTSKYPITFHCPSTSNRTVLFRNTSKILYPFLAAFSLDTPLLKTLLKSLRGGFKLKKSVELLDQGAAKAELRLKASVEQSVGLRLFKAGDNVFDDHFGGPASLRGAGPKAAEGD